MWRQPSTPANTFGPTWALVLELAWRALLAWANVAAGVAIIALLLAVSIVGAASIIAGEPMPWPPRIEAALDAFVLIAACAYAFELWNRRQDRRKREDLLESVNARLAAHRDALPDRVRATVRDMQIRGDL